LEPCQQREWRVSSAGRSELRKRARSGLDSSVVELEDDAIHLTVQAVEAEAWRPE